MAYAGHQQDHAIGADETGYGLDNKPVGDDHSELGASPTLTGRRREAPALVRNLSKEERRQLELALVRKIDFRLMPMVILMYILNYLDRNNIASARLAGLEADLHLSDTQFNVHLNFLLQDSI